MGRDDGDCRSFPSGTSGPADPMDIALGIKWEVVVEDMADIVDIQAPGGDIGGDEDLCLAVFESADRRFALTLIHISVQTFGVVSLGCQEVSEAVHLFFHPAKDDALVGIFVIEQPHQGIIPLRLVDDVEELADLFIGDIASRDGDGGGILEDALGQSADLFGHGRGEEEGLPTLGEMSEDLFDIVEKAHVKHLIRFVKDDESGREGNLTALEQVDEAAGSGDDYRGTLDMLDLPGVGAASINGGGADAQSFAEAEDLIADLGGQLPGGDDHQGFDAAIATELLKHGKSEGGGFAGTGMGLCDEVAPLQDQGDRLFLYRAGFAESRLFDGLGQLGFEVEVFEGHSLLSFQA